MPLRARRLGAWRRPGVVVAAHSTTLRGLLTLVTTGLGKSGGRRSHARCGSGRNERTTARLNRIGHKAPERQQSRRAVDAAVAEAANRLTDFGTSIVETLPR